LKPDFAGAHSNLGNTLQGLGRLKEAEASLRQATALAPDFAEGHNNLGNTLQMQGKMEEAITSYRQALTLNPDYTDAYYNMGNALKGIRFSKSEPHMSEIICTIIEKNNLVRPIEISETVISLLKLEPTIKKLIKKQKEESLPLSLQNTIISLSNIPLLMKILESCPIPDLDIEFLLREIRSELLLNLSGVQDNTDILLFQISLAAQCFINEYLYEKTDIEIQQIIKLEDLVENNLVKGNFPTANVIACLASYKSLGDYSWASSLSMPMELESLYRKQILEPKEENTLRSTISKHKAITDTISSKVREQYEQNPYPRWMSLQLQPFPKSITELASQLNLKIQDSSINGVNYPKVLIAGCGTGQQSIGSAIRLKDCDVLAVDLSLNSLAYAKRKTEELRISNIEYMQMDILDVGEISRKFDIIESVGVLHHMDDPMAGWKNLVECLNTGGLMNIGLYSESARRHVVKIRDEIKKNNINLSDDDIKSFRNQIVKSEKEHHKHIKLSLDLYSMSSIRDLLFHVQEHRFTIPQIKIHLEDLGLVFCGFEHPELSQIINSDVLSINNIYCLNEWEEFEIKNPHAFGGMYQFWCQKIG
jgi:SAM-dependent methyltransferase